jgi:hypothetical protein
MPENPGNDPVSLPSEKRKRGGQLNNKNAFKHGFYSKHFREFENTALDEIEPTDLTGEIDLMRVNIERFMEAYTSAQDDLDYEKRLAVLRAITIATGRIASLGRIQTSVGRNAEEARKLREQIMRAGSSKEETPAET